ncbi:MAG: hypothetical protein RhofKO_43190 [Rhodothermales bacterium]
MMTHTLRCSYVLMLLATLSLSAQAQTVDGRILLEAKGQDGVCAHIQLRADQALQVGTSTLLIVYDPEVLAVPSMASANSFLAEADYTSQLPEPSIPGTYSLTASLFGEPGTLALNLDLLVPSFGVRIDTAWTAFAALKFTHLNPTATPSLTWASADAAEPSILFADDNETLLSLGTLFDGQWATSTANEPLEHPDAFGLRAVYPNPFAQSTTIMYTMPEPGAVKLEVVDLLGRRITQLVEDEQSAGTYTVEWNAEDLASGLYILRLSSDTQHATHKIIRAR